MDEIKLKKHLERARQTNKVIFYLTIILAVANIIYLIIFGNRSWDETLFRFLQYAAMLLVLKLPAILKLRFRIEVPITLSVTIVIFAFSALILGDALDFYGKYSWWDSILHTLAGVIMSFVAFWLIHVLMAENDKYVYMNKYFLSIFILMFSIGLGACWEIVEYTYDSIMGTNTQQFMASTTGSIFTENDIPLCGHAALKDTMTDLILDAAGALLVSVFNLFQHEKIVERYQNYKKIHLLLTQNDGE